MFCKIQHQIIGIDLFQFGSNKYGEKAEINWCDKFYISMDVQVNGCSICSPHDMLKYDSRYLNMHYDNPVINCLYTSHE